MKNIKGNEYFKFLKEIKSRIILARIQAVRSVNRELIKLYWDIGKSIVERQKKFGWGKRVVEQLSRDLICEYSNYEGYSKDNLWRMRMFYLKYKDNLKLAQLVPELPWGHNILIMQKVKNIKEVEYYLTASIRFGWSRNVLLNQIKAGAYKMSLRNKTHNFPRALPKYLSEQADEAMKSVYNRKLKCLVALDLKTGKFQPEYAGKMDFYLHLLDEKIKLKDENPSIGIILCADKDQIVVEYALRGVKKPVGVAEYHLTNKLPRALKGKLPDAESLKLPIRREIGNGSRG